MVWKLALTALSERLDSDRPTCSRIFIFSWIMGLVGAEQSLAVTNLTHTPRPAPADELIPQVIVCGSLGDEVVDVHVAGLTDTVHPILSLDKHLKKM